MAKRDIGELRKAVQEREPVSSDWIAELGGFYWYRCVVDPSSPTFEHGDVSRAGWVLVLPTILPSSGFSVEIHALRLAATQDRTLANSPSAPLPAAQRTPWRGTGGLTAEDGRLVFKWESHGEEQGWTRESVLLPAEVAEVWPGTFSHTTAMGVEVTGTVRYRRLVASEPSPWVEPGTDPGFRTVLTPKLIGRWGTQVFEARRNQMPELMESPYVLVDVLAETVHPAGHGDWREAERVIKSHHPEAIIFRAETSRPLETSFGLGPAR